MKAALALLVPLLVAPPVRAQEGNREPEQFLRAYTEAWAAKDPALLSGRFYRFEDPNARMATQAGVAAEFARLAQAGYERSEIASIEGCKNSTDSALGLIRFTRLLRDGRPMPPKDRATIYSLRKFADGWRITAMGPFSPSDEFGCHLSTR
jgi:hypothetical protein